jgi:hypothetical protein
LSVGDLSIANYIFITDNEFYAEVMRRLKKEGYKIILVQSEMIVAELIEIADVIWSFHNFVRGLPPFFIKVVNMITSEVN